MTDIDALWELERSCWTKGRSFYEGIITDGSIYAFPPPMGIFKGSQFVGQMNEEGPFASVSFENQHSQTFTDTVVLVYEGTGKPAQGDARKSHCTSVWMDTESGWKLMVHHQTPLTS